MRKGKLGKIFIKYADPISLSKFIGSQQDQSLESMSLQLSKDLYQIQQNEQPISMNSLISTSLFYQPKMQVSFGQVKTHTHMLYHYIQDKQFKNYISAEP